MSPPQVEGSEIQQVFYLANRIDNNVRFTREACTAFIKVPRPFLKNALQAAVNAALAAGVSEVDETFVKQLRSTTTR